jgi:phosphatidylglycerophosphate synthase
VIANVVTASRIVLLAPLWVLMTWPGETAAWGALAVFVLAGLTDVVDGRIARARGEVSAFGAMLDLISDRLLTAVVMVGLIASGKLAGLWVVPALVLLGRDLVVASFGEATRGGMRFPVTTTERVKIALQFGGFGLLLAPSVLALQQEAGRWALALSAAVCTWTLVDYTRRAVAALR